MAFPEGEPLMLQTALRAWPLLFLPLLLPAAGLALEIGTGLQEPAPVSLEADQLTYDQATQTYRASGQVRLQRADVTLTAQEVVWDADSGEAVARGNVLLSDQEGLVEGEALSINLLTRQGRLEQGSVFLRERNFHLAGDEIEKLGEQTYRVTAGTFTTCDGEVPDWSFTARRVDVTLGEYARARHVFFRIRDIPVLYTPYLIYPVKTERESGFLTPRVGYSSRRGAQFSLAWYQVIDVHMDATFQADYLSRLGVGKGVEYRYLLGEDNQGILHGYHLAGIGDFADRAAFDWRHLGTLPGEVRLAADVEVVSRRDYYVELGERAEEYSRDRTQSTISLTRNWQRYSLAGQARHIRNLLADNDRTLQRLPEITFTASRQRIGTTPFFSEFDSSATNFWRREGVQGQRLTARPGLSAVFQPGGWVKIEPAVGYRERLYWLDADVDPLESGFVREGIFDFSTRTSTRFTRVFAFEGRRVERLQHSIEPEAIYVYIPREDQQHLPFFDAIDRIGPENRIFYALTNRFTTRQSLADGNPLYHELLYLRFSQSYDIDESRREILAVADERRPFSPLRTEAILRPTPRSFLSFDTHLDVYQGDFLTFNALGGVRDDRGNGLSVDYRYQRDLLQYVDGVADLGVLRPVFLNYRHRYDLQGRRELEKTLSLEYRSQCWSLFLTLRDRPGEQEYLVSFALSGIGRVAELGGSLRPEEGR